MGKAARNEKLKLSATFFNNAAAGIMIGAVFLPEILIMSQLRTAQAADVTTTLLGMLGGFSGAMFLHFYGRSYLTKIED